ncbi:MAG: rhodanese-like domain-containing protein, partial [Bdellovibrionota bacterium]
MEANADESVLTATDFLKGWLRGHGRHVLIDVRSEGEFQTGHLPGAVSLPILNDSERHLVGLRYKTQGQEAAIVLAHSLVDPDRARRVECWLKALPTASEATGYLFCWRGGLRSKTACAWINAAGGRTIRIEGGYKAVRAELLSQFETRRLLGFLTVTGYTGSGKTLLLRSIAQSSPHLVLDLESLANHRGSAFGNEPDGSPQPSQATFENAMALRLMSLIQADATT